MPPRSSPSITSTTKRAKCLSGSHSSTDGGRRNAVRRSKSRKLLIAIKPPFGANQWRDSSENQRRWVKSDRLLGRSCDIAMSNNSGTNTLSSRRAGSRFRSQKTSGCEKSALRDPGRQPPWLQSRISNEFARFTIDEFERPFARGQRRRGCSTALPAGGAGRGGPQN